MNGTSRLYRSTSDAMVGGVAGGLANYFKIDPTIVRIIFGALTFFSGGTFILVYMALWLLLPTAGSTASQPNDVIRENIDDIGNRVRGFTGQGTPTTNIGNSPGTANGMPGTPGTPPMGGETPVASAQQLPPPQQQSSSAQWRPGFRPQVLIFIGVFFLLMNLGVFRAMHLVHWGIWWPLLLIFFGFMMLRRRNWQ